MTLSLVQKDNWTNPTEETLVTGPGPSSAPTDDSQSTSGGDMICKRHKGTKLALLIHMIDGFVIEESNVPFKGESEKEEETNPESAKPVGVTPGVDEKEKQTVKQTEQDKGKENNEIANASMNSYPQDRDELMSLLPTSCKYCGGPLPEDRAMWGKRFCSVSCSKKYSVTCSQRVRKALQRRTSQSQQGGCSNGTGTPPSSSLKDYNDLNQSEANIRSPVNKKRRGGSNSHAHAHVTSGNRSRNSSTSEVVDTNSHHNDVTPRKPKTVGYGGMIPTTKFDGNIDFDFTFPPREPLGFGLNENDVDDDLFEGIEPLMKFSVIPMITWNTKEVYDYITNIFGCTDNAKSFRDEEIDGQALLLLKVEHMIHTMNLKLGPALKIASHLRLIKLQYGVETNCKYLSPPV